MRRSVDPRNPPQQSLPVNASAGSDSSVRTVVVPTAMIAAPPPPRPPLPPPHLAHRLDGLLADVEPLRVHLMLGQRRRRDRLERAGPDVQRDIDAPHAPRLDPTQKVGCEVQAGCRRRDRLAPGRVSVHRLIPALVVSIAIALMVLVPRLDDVRRQWRAAGTIEDRSRRDCR